MTSFVAIHDPQTAVGKAKSKKIMNKLDDYVPAKYLVVNVVKQGVGQQEANYKAVD